MIVNIIVLIVIGLLAFMLYGFRIRKTETFGQAIRLVPLSAFLTLFLVLNGVIAYVVYSRLQHMIRTEPLHTAASLERVETNEPVIIAGLVSASSETVRGDFVAYLDQNRLFSRDTMILDLADGPITLRGKVYEAKYWAVDYSGYRFIRAGFPVVVTGQLIRTTRHTEDGTVVPDVYLSPEIVFNGTRSDLVARLKRSVPVAMVLMILNLLGAVAAVGFPLRHALRRRTGHING